MADEENKDVPELTEFEAKLPAQGNNKDIWLFLIIVDVIFLCVFGFFLYKNLSARLLAPAENVPSPAPVAEEPAQQEPQAEEEIVVEETVSVTPQTPAAQPQEKPAPAVQETKPAPEAAPAQPKEQKESIIVKSGKSKYRQVTFRYFGDADNVSIVSGFTMSKPRALKKKKDYWEVTLGIAPGTYKFLYIVDGKQTLDPYAEEKDGRSVLVVK